MTTEKNVVHRTADRVAEAIGCAPEQIGTHTRRGVVELTVDQAERLLALAERDERMRILSDGRRAYTSTFDPAEAEGLVHDKGAAVPIPKRG